MDHTFACKHAYLDRNTGKNQVVLCDKAGTPDFTQYKSIVGCMCAYQPPCPEKHICALAKGWEGCWRLQQEQNAEQHAAETTEKAPKNAQKRRAKRSKKSQ